MRSTEYLVVALISLATTSRSEIVIADDQKFAPAVEALVNTVTSCYKDRIDGVLVASKPPDNLIESLARSLIPVVLIDETLLSRNVRYTETRENHKLRLFIVAPSSYEHLIHLIAAMAGYTPWWNYMASHIILDSTPKCDHEIDYLLVASICNAINAKVLCLEPDGDAVWLSTVNPFTRYAPIPWERMKVLALAGKSFAVFWQDSQRDGATCRNLDFDKTADVGGLELYVTRDDDGSVMNTGQPTSFNSIATNERIVTTVFDVLHAKLNFTPVPSTNFHIVPVISLTPVRMTETRSTRQQLYPHATSEMVVVTKFRGNESLLNKVINAVDVYTWYGLGAVCLITLISLMSVAHRAFDRALLDFIRLACSAGLKNVPNRMSAKIFVASLLFGGVVIHGLCWANVTSLLTKTISLRSVNTVTDLEDLDYENIYVVNSAKRKFNVEFIEKRIKPVDDVSNCLELVMKDFTAACLLNSDVRIDQATINGLYVSKEFLQPVYMSFRIRERWYLRDRVHKVISRMVESSVLEPWDVKCLPVKLTDPKVNVNTDIDFKKIDLSEVAFAFVILGTGLVCASVILVVELAIHRYNSRIRTATVEFLN